MWPNRTKNVNYCINTSIPHNSMSMSKNVSHTMNKRLPKMTSKALFSLTILKKYSRVTVLSSKSNHYNGEKSLIIQQNMERRGLSTCQKLYTKCLDNFPLHFPQRRQVFGEIAMWKNGLFWDVRPIKLRSHPILH